MDGGLLETNMDNFQHNNFISFRDLNVFSFGLKDTSNFNTIFHEFHALKRLRSANIILEFMVAFLLEI